MCLGHDMRRPDRTELEYIILLFAALVPTAYDTVGFVIGLIQAANENGAREGPVLSYRSRERLRADGIVVVSSGSDHREDHNCNGRNDADPTGTANLVCFSGGRRGALSCLRSNRRNGEAGSGKSQCGFP